MAEEIDLKSISLEDKCTHKLWKVRINGYEECIEYFNKTPEADCTEFGKFENFLKIFCLDSNAVALDKALEAVAAVIKNYPVSSRTVADIAEGIVSKSLAAAKKSTQDKAINVLLICCEIEKFEPVQEELRNGFSHKNPKVVSGCLRTLTSVMRAFGQKAVDIKLILKSAGKLFDNRDKTVRYEAKMMIVEMYRWLGEELLSELTSLKPLVLQDLKIDFKKLGNEKATPKQIANSRRSHQKLKTTEEKISEMEIKSEEVTDCKDLSPEINILDKLPRDFTEKIEAKNWQDRREILETLLPLTKSVKFASGDYYDIIMALTKVIAKDTNVVLVTLAGNCLSGIAKGLHKQFSSYAIGSLKIVLGKFKEKKQTVLVSLREAADAIFRSVNIDLIREVSVPFLTDKNPNVKQETAYFIARCFCYCTPKMLNKKILKFYVTPLLKALNEPDRNVRNSAAEALGTALKIVGEGSMATLIDGVEPIKLQKIRECSKQAVIKVNTTLKKKITTENSTASEALTKNLEPVGNESIRNPLVNIGGEQVAESNPVNSLERLPTEKVKSFDTCKQISTTGTIREKQTVTRKNVEHIPLLQTNFMKKVRVKDEERCRTSKWEFTYPHEDFITQLKSQMESAEVNRNLIAQMFHPDYKFHLKCIDELQKDLFKNLDACIANLDIILRWLTLRFFDTNLIVILKSFDYLTQVFKQLSNISYYLLDFEAQSFLPYLILKFGESNESVRNAAISLMSVVCNVYPSSKISPFIIEGLKSSNWCQKTSCLEALASLIERIGIVVCQPNPTTALTEVSKLITDNDSSVKTAAVNVFIQVYKKDQNIMYDYMGMLPNEGIALLEKKIKSLTISKTETMTSPATPSCQILGNIETNRMLSTARETINKGKLISPLEDTDSFKSKFKADYDFLKKIIGDDDDCHENVETNAIVENLVSNISPIFHNKENSPLRVKQISPLEDTDCSVSNFRTKVAFLKKTMDENECSENVKTNATAISNVETNLSPVIYNREMSPLRNHNLPTEDNVNINHDIIDTIISQISHGDYTTIMAAIAHFEEFIALGKHEIISPVVDQLLLAITKQCELSLDCQEPSCVGIFQSLTNFLEKIFQEKELATIASRDSLYAVVNVVLNIVVFSNLCQLEGGIDIIRKLNNFVVLIIQNADYTQIFSVLLKLLHNGVKTGLNEKFTELAMKCTWKAIRALPARQAELNIKQILGDLNEFLIAFPLNTWSDKSSNKPLRTIKTVLHNLVETYGTQTLRQLHEVPNYNSSELEKYIIKLLNANTIKQISNNKK